MADHRNRPRRRGAALEDAIITAAIEELEEVGFAGMTIESVARRAGAGKISVYRRWPSRAELAAEVAYRFVGEPPLPPEPSTFRADFLAWGRYTSAQLAGPAGEALRGIISESFTGDHAAKFSGVSRGTRIRILRELLRRAHDRGEPVLADPPLVRLQAPSTLMQHHFLTHGAPAADDVLVAIVDEVAIPLLMRG